MCRSVIWSAWPSEILEYCYIQGIPGLENMTTISSQSRKTATLQDGSEYVLSMGSICWCKMLSYSLSTTVFQLRVDSRKARSFPLDGCDLKSISDQALITFFATAPVIHQLGSIGIVRISKDLVIKGGEDIRAFGKQRLWIMPRQWQTCSSQRFIMSYTKILIRSGEKLALSSWISFRGAPCMIAGKLSTKRHGRVLSTR